jgi:electron-transferring-flavoprotein dehydrogenase
MVKYGAKALPEGGWNTIPRCHMDGALIAGDAGGFLNSFRLKGIHLAMKTGMLAAETVHEALDAADTSEAGLAGYQRRIDEGSVRAELYPVRQVHQAFGYGLVPGVLFSGLTLATGGWSPFALPGHAGHERMRTLDAYYGAGSHPEPEALKPDRVLTFDRLTDVPAHLLVHTEVCETICGEEYGHPCTRFCPASVYEIVRGPDGRPRLQVNASNCVHCKTCDIMDPYQVITWVPPEGGGGPQYDGL